MMAQESDDSRIPPQSTVGTMAGRRKTSRTIPAMRPTKTGMRPKPRLKIIFSQLAQVMPLALIRLRLSFLMSILPVFPPSIDAQKIQKLFNWNSSFAQDG
jgi:hypothetical protein